MSVLTAMELQGAKLQVVCYQMLVQCLAITGQIQAGFALLAWAEATGLLSHSDSNWYPMFRMMLEACGMVGESCGTSWVQAVVKRLDLFSLTPVAMVLVQSSERWCENGVGGEGSRDWLELCR